MKTKIKSVCRMWIEYTSHFDIGSDGFLVWAGTGEEVFEDAERVVLLDSWPCYCASPERWGELPVFNVPFSPVRTLKELEKIGRLASSRQMHWSEVDDDDHRR